jgi:hypothetical protein
MRRDTSSTLPPFCSGYTAAGKPCPRHGEHMLLGLRLCERHCDHGYATALKAYRAGARKTAKPAQPLPSSLGADGEALPRGTVRPRAKAGTSTFRLLGDAMTDNAPVEVVVRNGEMVLEVVRGDDDHYLLVGRLAGGYYTAVESTPPEGVEPVRAKWAVLGESCVGIWVEDGEELLFSFTLPNARTE